MPLLTELDGATWLVIIITFFITCIVTFGISWLIAANYYKKSSANIPDWFRQSAIDIERIKDDVVGSIALPLAAGDYTLVIEGKMTSTVRDETVRGNGLIIRRNPDDWHIKRIIVIWGDRALELDFRRGQFPRVPRELSFTRASRGTYHPRLVGDMVMAGSDEPRFEEISPGVSALLLEDARTNLLKDSNSPASQVVHLQNGTFTLWVEGRGTASVSGAANGAATDETPLVFEPEPGVLNVIVTGELTRFQLEAGSSPTSYIQTSSTATVTRAADHITTGPGSGSGLETEGTLICLND